MKKPSIGFLLRAFDYNKVHTSYIIMQILKTNSYGYEDLEEAVVSGWNRMEEGFKEKEKYLKMMSRVAGICPECKSPLGLRPIAIPKGKKNIRGYKSHWFCPNEDCSYEKYSNESIEELVKMEG